MLRAEEEHNELPDFVHACAGQHQHEASVSVH